MSALFDSLSKIKVLLFDVDGVFTNSQMQAVDGGGLERSVNTRDGMAVKRALQAGLQVGIITKGNSPGVLSRFSALGIQHVEMNMPKKLPVYEALKSKMGFEDQEALYMGDDLSDLEVLLQVGVSSCPSDAAHEVLNAAKYISSKGGGYGCVREVIEKILRLQGKW